MGQKIAVQAKSIGNVALFDSDRSITGQDGIVYYGAPDLATEPPAVLADRLFRADTEIESVFVLSNTVSVNRSGGWDEQSLDQAKDIVTHLFVFYEEVSPEEYFESLREENYNAAITRIRKHHEDLWIMWVKTDEPIEPFKPGQYTTLGLGYWEPRADDAMENFEENPDQLEKMARRSYSVSSSIVDDEGNLLPPHSQDVEFYIVQVRPEEDEEDVPALTPRIFTKEVGDRIFMSHKFTGRYTLDDVSPQDNVVFLSTGTGEAPQNTMTAELLRNGHEGKILNVVCVRYRNDLAYTEQQAMVEEQFPNYRFVVLTTREPENEGNKVYIQDLIETGGLEEELGAPLDPDTTHVFLCGNPAMIGLPSWDDDGNMTFPETVGCCQLLSERGFTIDHLRERGNVHYEEYWKDRS